MLVPRNSSNRRRQQGIALVVLMAVVALASVGVLLDRLNRGAATPEEDVRQNTRLALQEARELLLGAAVGDVPDGNDALERPGQLPWPDRAEAVNPDYDGWSDCVTADVVGAANLLGRFPYLGEVSLDAVVPAPAAACLPQLTSVRMGTRVVDGTGEPLWYAVSRNLLHTDTSADAQTQLHSINPDIVRNPPYGWLRVCDTAGNLLSDRVAAVIIAPGPALAGQDRSGAAPAAANFLDTVQVLDPAGAVLRTLSNADSDGGPDDVGLTGAGLCGSGANLDEQFVTAAGTNVDAVSNATFNDELVYITADEILEAAQQRALNVAANALEAYRLDHGGRLPWLSPFLNAAEVTAQNATGVAASIVDTVDAVAAGPQRITLNGRTLGQGLVGAPIRNVTDGSTAVITVVANVGADTVLTVSTLIGGTNNVFADDDSIEIALFREDAWSQTTEGLLAFEDPAIDEDVVSDFRVDWDFSASAAGAGQPVSSAVANQSPALLAAHEAFVRSSALTGAVMQVNNADPTGEIGVCRLLDDGVQPDLRCQGQAVRFPFLRVTHTTGTGPAPGPLDLHVGSAEDVDTAGVPFDFANWGISVGDRVRVNGDPARGVVSQIATSGENARLSVFALENGGAVQFVDGQDVLVEPAGRVHTGGTATGGGPLTLVDTASDFVGLSIQAGDVIVLEQVPGLPSYGIVDTVASVDTLTVQAWYGNPVVSVAVNDPYEIRSGFLAQRRMTFDIYISGSNDFAAVTTDDPLGTTTRVASTPAGVDVPLPVPAGGGTENVVISTIRTVDVDFSGATVADSSLLIQAGMTGTLAVDNITRHMQVGDGLDLPTWFVTNGWHQFIHVSLADDARPIGAGLAAGGVCAANCLTVYRDRAGAVPVVADQLEAGAHAVLVGAGPAITVGGALQARTGDVLADFFEGENVQNTVADPLSVAGDREFELRPSVAQNTGFNDAVRILR